MWHMLPSISCSHAAGTAAVLSMASKARCCPCPQTHPSHPPHPSPKHHPCRGFKALKQIVKLHFKLGQKDKMMEAYRWVCLPRPAPRSPLPAAAPCGRMAVEAGPSARHCPSSTEEAHPNFLECHCKAKAP
jgi:hypothetical protein